MLTIGLLNKVNATNQIVYQLSRDKQERPPQEIFTRLLRWKTQDLATWHCLSACLFNCVDSRVYSRVSILSLDMVIDIQLQLELRKQGIWMDFLHSSNIIMLHFPGANALITWMEVTRGRTLKERRKVTRMWWKGTWRKRQS